MVVVGKGFECGDEGEVVVVEVGVVVDFVDGLDVVV